ncbi:PKD domain-containing protein [bacterium]|nr:PKD domain-containing protein [bacterium]
MDYATAAAGPPLSVNMDSDFTTGPIDFTFNLTINGGDIFSWDLDADGEFEFPDTTNDQLELPVTVARMLRPAVLAESGTTGAGLLSLSLLAYQNEDPVADLQASDYVDDAPMNVEFDASGSMDPDGYIVDYEWDLDGDDIYSENGAEADARGLTIVNHTYEQAGLYNVTVRITDDSGAQDAATVLIRVKGWIVVTIATSSLHLGENVSLAAVDGWPAICYEDLSIQQQLKYIRATTSTGTSAKDWPESIAVDPTCQVGSGSSLAVIDGNPAVAFYDGVNFNLKYARSSTSTGIGEYDWQPSFTVDNNSAVGEDPSLTIIDGNPAISYYDLSNGRLKYARANNSTGVGGNVWTTRLTIDDAEQVGSASRLATIDGHPAISYSDNFTQRLKYVRADTADGADADDWTQLVNLDDTYFLGGCHNLATVSTRPALACFVDINPPDHDTYELRYFRALSSSGSLGTDWSDYVVIDNCQLGGDFAEIMLSDGLPLVAYFGGTADELKCAWSDTETGAHATDWSMDTIDAAFDKGQAVSMAEIAGAPAIAYIVETGTYTKALRYAWWYD